MERLERVSNDGKGTIEITDREAFRWLERWRNPTQIVVAAGTDSLGEVLAQIAARAGYPLTVTGAIAGRQPALTLNPGESGRSAAERLMGRVAQRLYERQGTLALRDLLPQEPPLYIHGPPDYAAEAQRYAPSGYWKLGEPSGQALDTSGNANHGTVTLGTGARDYAALNVGGDGCIDFDGADTRVTVSSADPIDSIFDGGGSLAVLFNLDSTGEGTAGRLIQKDRWWFRTVDASGGACKINWFYQWTGGTAEWQTTSRVLTFGHTYLWVLTYNADAASNDPEMHLYNLTTGTLTTLTVGTGSATIDGRIDEALLFPTALTTPQVQALADAARGPGHTIARLTDRYRLLEHNAITVHGAGRSDVAYDSASQWKSGPAPDLTYDRTNTTNAYVTEHAAALLGRARALDRGELVPSLPNVGQELYDVIALGHLPLGISAARRVAAIRIDYRRARATGAPRFTQTLTLEEP